MSDDIVKGFVDAADPRFAEIVTALDVAIVSSEERLTPAVKWGHLTYGLDGDFHHWICALAVTKKWVSLRFHFGGLLSDPDQVFRAGASKFLRSIDYVKAEEVDAGLVGRYVREALSRLDYFKANWKRLNAE
jgi:hypothetical protein